MIPRTVLIQLAVGACASSDAPPPAPMPQYPPPPLQADPVAAGEEPTHGAASLPFTITRYVGRQTRQLSPPYYGEAVSRAGESTYVEATLGGGTFGWLVETGTFDRVVLIPSSTSDGARVVAAFAEGFGVWLPKPREARPFRSVEVPATNTSRVNGWVTATWRCEEAEVFVQFNLSQREGRFVQKNRNGSWNWANCLAVALRDG